jgi:hypothetical protein
MVNNPWIIQNLSPFKKKLAKEIKIGYLYNQEVPMIRKIIKFVVLLIFSFGLFYCAPPRPVHQPPPPRNEVRPAKPGPNYVWVSGHHEWRGGRWVWVSGHWVKKRPGMEWVEGHWVKRGNRWVWVKGHWKRR